MVKGLVMTVFDDGDTLIRDKYEYAGFEYEIHEIEGRVIAIPRKEQHAASRKEKHRKAAVNCFEQEYKWSERIRND